MPARSSALNPLDALRANLRASVADERLEAALDLIDSLPWKPRPDGEDYRMHLLRVAHRVRHEFGLTDPDLVIAALLHDVLEDQRAALGDEPLSVRFGPRVLELVESLTNPPGDYATHVLELLHKAAGPVKLADFMDNALTLDGLKEGRRQRLRTKYAPVAAGMIAWLGALPPTHPLAPVADKVAERIATHYP